MIELMKEELYDELQKHLDDENFESVKSVTEDLVDVGIDDEELEHHYRGQFGEKYSDPDTGLPRFLIDIVSLGCYLIDNGDYSFYKTEFVRAVVFNSIERFIHEYVQRELEGSFTKPRTVFYYFQKKDVVLSELEFAFISGYHGNYSLYPFYSGVKDILNTNNSKSVGFDLQSSVSQKDESDSLESSEKQENDSEDIENDSLENLDELEMDEIEDSLESNANTNQEEESSNEEDGSNEKEEEAAASFDELFGD